MQLSRGLLSSLCALSLPFLLGNKGCETTDPGASLPDASVNPSLACSEAECGPRPTAPSFVCQDGSLGGYGACRRGDDGSCGYPYHACSEHDGGAAEDAGSVDAAQPEGGQSKPEQCGTRGLGPCALGEYCSYSVEAACGSADAPGTCQPMPDTCDAVYAPVCGCDNRSYSNACEAASKGVSAQRRGLCNESECTRMGGQARRANGIIPACATGDEQWPITGADEEMVCCLPPVEPGQSCGGFAGLSCGPGQWCNVDIEAGGHGCDVADGSGVCAPIKLACTKEYQPVCGCDRRTYANRCTAHAQQVSVLHDGLCSDEDCKSVGGRPVDGLGPAPSCAVGEVSYGAIRYASGQIAIEGTICCVKE